MTQVAVRPVHTAADLKRFIAFPYRLYRGHPLWVPPLRMDVAKLLDRDKNPFFQHATAQYYLAEDPSGEILGRVAAIHNQAHNEFHEDRVGFFGFFECVDVQEVATALLDQAAEWVRQRGLDTIRGPVSPSTNDECGLLVDGFETPPTVLTPYTPPYYAALVEGAGFHKTRDLFQYQTVNNQLPEELVARVQRIAMRQNITLRAIDMKDFDAEVERIKQIYNGAWEKNWGFVPMTDAEIDHMAADLKKVVEPDLIVFVEKDRETIGFAAALPDLNVALKTNPSGRLFPGILTILWAARKIQRIRILLLGLKKEYRRTGADVLMYHWIWDKGYAKGFRWAEAGWILEDNPAMNNGLSRLGFEHYKTLRLYDRLL